LGAHALGVKNILAVTGDPANIGDYPSATSVFDVDSIGLVRILSRFNEGVDLAGNSVGKKCAYTIAVAYNPLAQDLGLENDRLARKADAGAHLVYTQPIFDEEHMQIALDQCQRHGLPLFVGVLPLRSTRHAEFMHNEVPGIVIPERLRHLMANAENEEQALELGIAEAQSLSEKIKTVAQGLYLMPPFGNHGIAIRVMEAVQ
jgi:homocysteine S-methyltransferase